MDGGISGQGENFKARDAAEITVDNLAPSFHQLQRVNPITGGKEISGELISLGDREKVVTRTGNEGKGQRVILQLREGAVPIAEQDGGHSCREGGGIQRDLCATSNAHALDVREIGKGLVGHLNPVLIDDEAVVAESPVKGLP